VLLFLVRAQVTREFKTVHTSLGIPKSGTTLVLIVDPDCPLEQRSINHKLSLGSRVLLFPNSLFDVNGKPTFQVLLPRLGTR
jgi:hypothetical protein